MIAIAIVNYKTAEATIACLDSLFAEAIHDACVFLLDNASGSDEYERLRAYSDAHAESLRFFSSDVNLGFAGGTNTLLTEVLRDSVFDSVLLLNSDTRATQGFIAKLQLLVDPDNHVDMIGGRMLDDKNHDVDSLGITLFRSTLASNRKREDEVLLGPSGGCALLTRRLLEDVRAVHGEWFDERFFCYAEDTDLVVRARWLGYRAAYASDAIVYHIGSLSSGGPDSDFVLYHGIRNSIWWLVKNAPIGWFLLSLPWFVALHVAIWIRHLRRGKARVLWRLYRDAMRGIPEMRRKRAIIKKSRRVPARTFASWVEPHFYQRDYVRRAWRELFSGAPKS
jgi:N-acetylglucosaminyl-diphospho-decaprenol L-rhamnosyltransferase